MAGVQVGEVKVADGKAAESRAAVGRASAQQVEVRGAATGALEQQEGVLTVVPVKEVAARVAAERAAGGQE